MSIIKAFIEEKLEIFATSLADLKTCKIGAHIIEMTLTYLRSYIQCRKLNDNSWKKKWMRCWNMASSKNPNRSGRLR